MLIETFSAVRLFAYDRGLGGFKFMSFLIAVAGSNSAFSKSTIWSLYAVLFPIIATPSHLHDLSGSIAITRLPVLICSRFIRRVTIVRHLMIMCIDVY